jgi:hypothetical protein
VAAWWQRLRSGDWSAAAWLLLPVLAGAWLVRRQRVRRRARAAAAAGPSVPFYVRLLAILARRCGLQPRPAQTPRELAEAAAPLVRGSAGEALAAVPGQVVVLYYRVRFGHQALAEHEGRDVERRLQELDAGLNGGG